MPFTSNFQKIPLEERQSMSKNQLNKRPEWCPVAIEPSDKNQPVLKGGCKFLFNRDVTMGSVMAIVRDRIKTLDAKEALWMFVWDFSTKEPTAILAENTKTIGAYYDEYKSNDGFLLIQYTRENVFGEGTE